MKSYNVLFVGLNSYTQRPKLIHMTNTDEDIARNRHLAERIAAGASPLNDELIETMRQNGEAFLNVPGPRVVQLVEEIERLKRQAAPDNLVCMSVTLASGERVTAWLPMADAARIWHA